MQTAPEQGKLTVGNTDIDLKCYEVNVKGESVLLSPKEVEILHLMASHPRQVFSREQLLDNIWGFDFNGDPRVVDTSIKRIRKKLPEDTDVLLRSVYGVGYKVEVREDA
jgi:DNA-binding response OmpR family regulator